MADDWTAVERCRKPSGWGRRHTLALLGFWGFALSYAMRFSLSIAIVAMVNNTAIQSTRHGKNAVLQLNNAQSKILFKSDICPHDTTPHEMNDLKLNLLHVETFVLDEEDNGRNGTRKDLVYKIHGTMTTPRVLHNKIVDYVLPTATLTVRNSSQIKYEDQGEFVWSEADQGLILGSFFWGYVLTQIGGGWISQRIGGKWPFSIGLFITALFSIITPTAARLGGKSGMMVIRVVQGLAGGVTVPSMQAIIAVWFPPEERGKLGSLTYAGMPFGTSLSLLCSGFLIHYFGWPSVFYATGGLTVLWFILWSFLTYSSPFEDPKIDKAELNYIQASFNHGRSCQKSKKNMKVPWTRVLRSPPFWAILLGNTCECFFLYTIMTELPSYMSTVLHFDIKENSIMSAFPHLLTLLVSIVVSNVGDNLIERQFVSIGTVRKASTSIALWGSAAALLGVAYSGCDRVKTVALLAVAVAANGGKFSGFLVNLIDIAPNYSGILMGVVNSLSSAPGFFAPYIAGMILNDDPSLENWRLVFIITAGIAFCGNLVYILFASGEEQSWNRSDESRAQQSKALTLKRINQAILFDERVEVECKKESEDGVYIIPPGVVKANEQPQQQIPPPMGMNLVGDCQDEKNGIRCSA